MGEERAPLLRGWKANHEQPVEGRRCGCAEDFGDTDIEDESAAMRFEQRHHLAAVPRVPSLVDHLHTHEYFVRSLHDILDGLRPLAGVRPAIEVQHLTGDERR